LAGTRLNLPALILMARLRWFVASNGGARLASSYSRQPSAQMSLFSLYLSSFCRGAGVMIGGGIGGGG